MEKLTLEKWLKGNDNITWCHLNPGIGASPLAWLVDIHDREGGMFWNKKTELWAVDILEDGTAITYCIYEEI
jgi:hypothetical protein